MRTVARLVVMAALLAGGAWGQEKDAAREADHQALRALMAKAVNALNKRDVATLTSCLTEPYAFITSDQTLLTNRAELDAYYARIFTGPNALVKDMQTTATPDVPTLFTSSDTGYCYGTAVDTYTLTDGRRVAFQSRWTAVVVRKDGRWLAAAVHTGVNFTDNPLLQMRTMSWWRKLGLGLGVGKLPGEV